MRFACEPLSRRQIRDYTRYIREYLNLNGALWFPVVGFLETMHSLIGDDDFNAECVEDYALPPGIHAQYDLQANVIQIKESVYLGASNGNGRDRMTVAHECGHVLFLRHSKLKLARSFDDNIPTYCDPEWQAKCFAGELLIPFDLVNGMSASEIASKCGVSLQAAEYQLKINSRSA